MSLRSSWDHVLVIVLPMSIVLLLLMVLHWRSHLLIVIIIYWSLDVVDRLHGILVVIIDNVIGTVGRVIVDLINNPRVKGVNGSLLRSLMLQFLILGRATNGWTRHIDIPPKIILVLDAVIDRDELLVALLLVHVFISLHG